MLWSPPSANPIGHDLLVKKGNELHLLILLTSLVYAVVYGAVDFYMGLNLQAFIILGFALITLTNLALFRRGWVNTSKILNLLTVSAIIAGLSWITGQETMVLAFFCPHYHQHPHCISRSGAQKRICSGIAHFYFCGGLDACRYQKCDLHFVHQ